MGALTFDEALDRCLDMLRAGLAVEQCLTYYPVYASELRPQLEAGHALLSTPSQIAPAPPAQARGRARLLNAAAQQRAQPAPAPTPAFLPPWLSARMRQLTALPPAALLAVGLLLLGGAAVGVSAATGQGPVGALLTGGSQSHDNKLVGTVTARDCTAGTLAIDQTLVQITPDTDLHGLTCEQIALGMQVKVGTSDGAPGQPLVADDVQLAGQANNDHQGDCPATPTPTATGGTSGGCDDNGHAACPTDAAPTPTASAGTTGGCEHNGDDACPVDTTPTPLAGENDDDCDDGQGVGDGHGTPGSGQPTPGTPEPTEVDDHSSTGDGDHEDANDQPDDSSQPGDIHDNGDDGTGSDHRVGTPQPTVASSDGEGDGSDQEGNRHGQPNGETDTGHANTPANPDNGSNPEDGQD